jgi:hypothetical protein
VSKSKQYIPREPYKRGGVIYEHIYELTLYLDSKNAQFSTVLTRLVNAYPNMKYVYALHNMDATAEGMKKKEHYHLLIVFPREVSMNKIIYIAGIPDNLIEWKQFLDKSVQYLIHINDPDKYQYDLDILEGTLDFIQYFESPKQSNTRNELNLIIEFINQNKGHLTLYNIFCFCRDNQLLITYKSWYHIIKDIYQEN